MSIILGIDPGSRITGFGLIEVQGAHVMYRASGCIRMEDKSFAERLRTIFEGIQQLITQFQPSTAVVEQVFVSKNALSALKLGQARGAAITACAVADLVIHEYTPAYVKQSLTGTGRATKEQMQHMVRSILKLPGLPATDAADALALAICYAQVERNQSLVRRRTRAPEVSV